ncbi:antibiotic biosynthesis monooxygenase [Streptomyces angustmyceticus]|uniref:antibiotic biosynthesis monooxygenase n=1 Tax=Streptomyces angustmyceticus TaxID=285578 RepID=UPI001CBBF099|nr:antibiotic biosynthesis monooxygenase [Streptomyces angustmyceticus]
MSARASRGSAADSATVVTSQKVREGRTDEYQRWQDRTNQAAREFEGFVGAEVYPPGPGEENEWVAVFQFSGMDRLTAWLDSGRRQALLDEARGLFEGPPTAEVLHGGTPAQPAPDVVTAVISHDVKPGSEQGFLNWQQKTLKAQEKAPGFMGSELFKPVEGVQEHWVVVFRFDSREHLDAWLASDVRAKLLKEGSRYFTSYDVRKVGSAFSGWFRFDRGRADVPPNWKQAMSVVLALYPTVMVLNLTVGVGLEKLTVREYIGLFLSNVLSVSALTWLLMPLVNRVFAFWLVPSRVAGNRRAQVLGLGLVVLGYLVCIGVFGLITRQIW